MDLKIKIIIILIVFLTSTGFTDRGMSFLNIPVGAKQSALGGAGVSRYDDSFSFIHNPAVLPLLNNGAAFNYKKWFAEINIMQIAVNMNLSGIGALGIGFQSGGVTFDEYNQAGTPIGELSASDTIVQMGYGKELLDNLTLGGGVLLMRNSLDEYQGSTIVAFSTGGLYRMKLKLSGEDFGINTGLSIRNLGFSSKYEDYTASIPVHVIGGLNIQLPWYNIFLPLEFGMKAGEMDFIVGAGSQYKIVNIGEIGIQFGFPFQDDLRKFTTGLEVGYNIKSESKIKANFTYELLQVGNALDIGFSFCY